MKNDFQQLLGVKEYLLDKPLGGYSKFIYGTVPFRPIHLGFDPLLGLVKYLILEQNLKCKIILGDTFAFIDKGCPIFTEQYKNVLNYYKFFFSSVGVKESDFILHSETMEKIDYWKLVMKCSLFYREREITRSSPEKEVAGVRPLSMLLHPLLQTVDVCFHKPDLVIGYSSQRRIYMMSKTILKKMNYQKNLGFVYLQEFKDVRGNLLVNSSSETRISYHESKTSLQKKIDTISYTNREVLLNIFILSLYPFVSEETEKKTSMKKNDFLTFSKHISNKDFLRLKGISVELLDIRFGGYRKEFKNNPALTSWINFNKLTSHK